MGSLSLLGFLCWPLFFVVGLNAQSADEQTCSTTNFFGPGCKYKCHCRVWQSCDRQRGKCNSEDCAQTFAGTSCQYEDLAFLSTPVARFIPSDSVSDLRDLVDGDSDSCFQEPQHQHLPFSVPVANSWVADIHILVKQTTRAGGEAANSRTLEVRYYSNDNSSKLLQPQRAGANDTLIKYHLPEAILVTSVEIRTASNAALVICEVNVLGGRNLALKKNASQGAITYADGQVRYTAELAVDGFRLTTFSDQSCSHTRNSPNQITWWTVVLGNNSNFWRVKVYNRQDYKPELLGGFLMNVSLADGSSREVYKNNDSRPGRIIDIMLPQPLEAVQVTLWLATDQKNLVLCEVEIFGDCVDGYFGWDCEKECRCEDTTELCDKILGHCKQSSCRTGYRGDDCQQECLPGTYGFTCAENCNTFCLNATCHHVTGYCTCGCRDGWQGGRCDQECEPGYYGNNCSFTCSSGCADSQCDHVTGACTQNCLPGKTGEYCNATCDEGFYGSNCSLRCSDMCLNNSCDAISGNCLAGCTEGVTGQICFKDRISVDEKGEPETKMWPVVVGAVVGVLFLLVAVLLAVFFIRRRRSRTKMTADLGKRSHGAYYENGETFLQDSASNQNSGDDGKNKTILTSEERASLMADVYMNQKAFSSLEQPHKLREKIEMPVISCSVFPEKTTSLVSDVVPALTTEPGPIARAERPRLVSLFSRDAAQDPPDLPHQQDRRLAPILETQGFPHPGIQPINERASPRSERSTPCLARHTISQQSLDSLSVEDVEMIRSTSPARMRRVTGDSDYYNVVCQDISPTTAIHLRDLPAKVAQWLENPRHFNRERSMLPAGRVCDWNIALLPENVKKNRYKDIYPYDHSRVMLTPLLDDPSSDFYNASFIDGFKKKNQYVAAQGPLDRTLYDFLRLVWDLASSRVVMLTNTMELGRLKCQQYWPEDEEELTSGDITVLLNATTRFADFCIRFLCLKRGSEERSVTLYHYTAWPDNYAPASSWSLLDFREKVLQGACDETPVVVHCSAGIGRTGTYLALDILLERAQHHAEVDVFTCVWKMRQQRTQMVQTLAQYIFIYETLAASLLTSVPVSVKDFRLECLLQGKNGTRLIDQEYIQLQRCLGPARDGEEGTVTPPEILALPRDQHRVHILSVNGTFSPAFINAIFVSNYSQPRAYIQTHNPSETSGAVLFLSMVVQHQVTAVICLEAEQVGTLPYWPNSVNEVIQFAPFSVTLVGMRKTRSMVIRKLRITSPALPSSDWQKVDQPQEDIQEVTHITCTAWPSPQLTPASVSVLLDLVNEARPQLGHPVVVHCRDGYTRSGLFCVAAAVLERIHVEDHVAVSYVTAHLRVPRRENIVNMEQYEFLYACAQHQINVDRGLDVPQAAAQETLPEEKTSLRYDNSRDTHDPTTEENTYENIHTRTAGPLSPTPPSESLYGNVVSIAEGQKSVGDGAGDFENDSSDFAISFKMNACEPHKNESSDFQKEETENVYSNS